MYCNSFLGEGAFWVAQTVNNLPAIQETWVPSLVRELRYPTSQKAWQKKRNNLYPAFRQIEKGIYICFSTVFSSKCSLCHSGIFWEWYILLPFTVYNINIQKSIISLNIMNKKIFTEIFKNMIWISITSKIPKNKPNKRFARSLNRKLWYITESN